MDYEGKRIYLLLGPSGAGKTTLGDTLKSWGIPEIISHTTRPIREGEVNGLTYYYVSDKEYDETEFVEKVSYGGNRYGCSKKEVERVLSLGDKCFVIVDLEGVWAFKEMFPGICTVIYIWLPYREMIKRMRARGDSEDAIYKRVVNAFEMHELDNLEYSDYCIINYDLKRSTSLLLSIVKV